MRIKYTKFILILSFVLQLVNASADSLPAPALYSQLQQQAVEFISDVRTADGEHDWKLLIYRKNGEQVLSVFDQETNQLIFKYSHEGPMDGFIRQQLVDWGNTPLIASVWRRGVHGEQFILLDPLNKVVLYKLTSAWPLSVQECEQGIAITVSDDTDTEGNPIQTIHYWHDPEFIEISKGDGSVCMTDSFSETILPIDDSHLSSSLNQFMQTFDSAVKNKDFKVIKSIVASDILNSFGGEGGMDEFLLNWENNQTELFKTLAEIRQGGGRLTKYHDGPEVYCMPRMFTDFPSSLNAFNHGVIFGEEIPVYAEPDKRSRVLTKLSHAIVGVDDWVWEKESWQEIRLKQDLVAFVESDKIRSPIDYRACLVQDSKGQWIMTQLVAGD